mgnify:FL=1
MATNPMQRKSRNSFLLGMLITLIITGLIIAFLAIQLLNIKKTQQKEATSSKRVYILSQDIKSGETIDLSSLKTKTITNDIVPSNAISLSGNENVVAKVDLKANTILTSDLITESDNKINNDTRVQEYNTIVLPINLEDGDYVDIRLSLPSGQNYIVVSKKKVEIPDLGGALSTDTIRLNLNEDEILSMSNAIYDAFKVNGSKLEAVKYTDPGMQSAATPTYPVNAEVAALLRSDSNILKEAMAALNARYSQGNLSELRNNYINSAISNAGDQAQTNAQQGMTESITNSKESRKEYLDSLSSY